MRIEQGIITHMADETHEVPRKISRRDFLKLSGAGMAAAALEPLARKLQSEEEQKNPNYMIGVISLEQPLKFRIPKEVAELCKRDSGLSADIYPLPEYGDSETQEDITYFNNWREHPNSGLVRRADVGLVANRNIMIAHSQLDETGRKLPFQWIVELYENDPESALGMVITVEQPIVSGVGPRNRPEKVQRLRIVDIRAVPASVYFNAFANYSDDNEPFFLRLDEEGGIGLPPSLRKDNQLTLVACAGDYVPQNPEEYTDRVFLTLEAIPQEKESKS